MGDDFDAWTRHLVKTVMVVAGVTGLLLMAAILATAAVALLAVLLGGV